MAQSDVAVPIIQLVALFLPAWAVMMQILTRIIQRTDFRESPLMNVVAGFGMALSFLSLYLFGLAGFNVMVYLGSAQGVTSGPLGQAIVNSSLGGLAFVGLGGIIILQIAQQEIPYPEVWYVFGSGVSMSFAGWLGFHLLSGFLTLALILAVFLVAMGVTIWADENDRLGPAD